MIPAPPRAAASRCLSAAALRFGRVTGFRVVEEKTLLADWLRVRILFGGGLDFFEADVCCRDWEVGALVA